VADDSQQQERTEEATPRRREKARQEGQVARSRELTTFTMLLGGIVALWSMSQYLYRETGLLMAEAFVFDRAEATDVALMLTGAGELTSRGLFALLPLFFFMSIVALIAPNLLGGFLISAKAVKPNWSKLNPIKGLKRIFSAQALAELAKVIAKIVLLATVAALFLISRANEFLGLVNRPVGEALAEMLALAAQMCGLMVLALVLVILIDVPFQLWSHSKQLRMTKEEIRREHKDTDGDPQLKARIRGQQQAMARRRMMANVPTADVVVTNPTHFAVALKYDETSMAAPRVVAKGADDVARRIRELAQEHDVPLLEAPSVARALYRHVDLEREVPFELYPVIAEIMAWAVNIKRLPQRLRKQQARPTKLHVPPALRYDEF
jgi:flagellar biosynthetic protein FlhB